MIKEALLGMRKCAQKFLTVKLMVGMILLVVLLIIHSYTDSVTDNRWALYNWEGVLCADTFVVTGCLVLMAWLFAQMMISFIDYVTEEVEFENDEDELVEPVVGAKIVNFMDYKVR